MFIEIMKDTFINVDQIKFIQIKKYSNEILKIEDLICKNRDDMNYILYDLGKNCDPVIDYGKYTKKQARKKVMDFLELINEHTEKK